MLAREAGSLHASGLPPLFLSSKPSGNSNTSHPINTGSRHACFLNYVYLAYVHIKEKSPSVPTQQKTCTNPRWHEGTGPQPQVSGWDGAIL